MVSNSSRAEVALVFGNRSNEPSMCVGDPFGFVVPKGYVRSFLFVRFTVDYISSVLEYVNDFKIML